MAFRNDSLLWYNVGDWAQLGLAVPNNGNDVTTQNGTIHYLTKVMGRNLQAVMFHTDARLTTPPSINTLARVHSLCVRARSILASRAVPSSQYNMESAHNLPAPEEFLVYPAPYFTVRNQWLKEWSGLIHLAISECFQHQENAKPLEISEAFSGLIGQYIHRVYKLMSVELFQVPVEEANRLDFTLTPEHLASYNPGQFFTSTEMIDTVHPHAEVPTEDDLEVLTNGIPVSRLPLLKPWPSAGLVPPADPATAPASSTSFAKPPGA